MSIYGDMNYYGNLLKKQGSHVYYAYGCRLDNMSGILMIDTEEKPGTMKNYQTASKSRP